MMPIFVRWGRWTFEIEHDLFPTFGTRWHEMWDCRLVATLRKRRQVMQRSTHAVISAVMVGHHACRFTIFRVLSALRWAPRTPTWQFMKILFFYVKLIVACPAGTIGTQRTPRGTGSLTSRSRTPSEAIRKPVSSDLADNTLAKVGSVRCAANDVTRRD